MFLSEGEVVRLTGKKRHSAQIRWLTDRGYKFEVNGLGQPIVAEAEVTRKAVVPGSPCLYPAFAFVPV
jgi:hypothetical protein